MTTPTLDHQITELKRELALRKNVYPKFVASRKMRQAEADLSTERMVAALHTVMAVKRLRATMMEHHFIESACMCSCGQWSAPSIDQAFEAHIAHVFERSKAAEEAHP